MGRKASVTLEDVQRAVGEIEGSGAAVGVVAVMDRIGGSYPLVKGFLDQIKAGRGTAPQSTALDGVIVEDEGPYPAALQPVFDGIKQSWLGMVAAERDRADRTILSAQQAADRRVSDAERRSESLQALLDQTEDRLADVSVDLEDVQAKTHKLEIKVQRLEKQLAEARGRLEGRSEAVQGGLFDEPVAQPVAQPTPSKPSRLPSRRPVAQAEPEPVKATRAPAKPFSAEELDRAIELIDGGSSLRQAAVALGREADQRQALHRAVQRRKAVLSNPVTDAGGDDEGQAADV